MSSTAASASTIDTRIIASGFHMLKMDDYARTKSLHITGHSAPSPEFKAAGHTWVIRYFPNGHVYHLSDGKIICSADYVSLHLELTDDTPSSFQAIVQFSLVPHLKKRPSKFQRRGEPPQPYAVSEACAFSKRNDVCSSFEKFIKRSTLEKSNYLEDNRLAIRCDIAVVEVYSVGEPVLKARDLERLGVVCECKDDTCKRYHKKPFSWFCLR